MRFWCAILGHTIDIVQEFSPVARKIYCDRCKCYFAMHDEYRAFVEWDEDFEDLYSKQYGFGRTLK
jgi:hypothetical protein